LLTAVLYFLHIVSVLWDQWSSRLRCVMVAIEGTWAAWLTCASVMLPTH